MKKEKEEAIKELKNYINSDTTLIIVIKSVSRSGMARRMRVHVSGSISDITYWIGRLCNLSCNERGLLVTGCGMDMAFWLADYITKCLYWEEGTTYADYTEKIKSLNLSGNGKTCLEWIVL